MRLRRVLVLTAGTRNLAAHAFIQTRVRKDGCLGYMKMGGGVAVKIDDEIVYRGY